MYTIVNIIFLIAKRIDGYIVSVDEGAVLGDGKGGDGLAYSGGKINARAVNDFLHDAKNWIRSILRLGLMGWGVKFSLALLFGFIGFWVCIFLILSVCLFARNFKS